MNPEYLEYQLKFFIAVSGCRHFPKGLRQKAFERVRKLHFMRSKETIHKLEVEAGLAE